MAYTDTYTTQDNFEAWYGIGTPDATTDPTLDNVTRMAEGRAGQLYNRMFLIAGSSTPGPPSYDVVIDTGTDVGKALDAVLDRLNAIGNAIDALEAAGAEDGTEESAHVERLKDLWDDGLEKLDESIKAYIGLTAGGRSETHLSTGESVEEPVGAATVAKLEATIDEEF